MQCRRECRTKAAGAERAGTEGCCRARECLRRAGGVRGADGVDKSRCAHGARGAYYTSRPEAADCCKRARTRLDSTD